METDVPFQAPKAPSVLFVRDVGLSHYRHCRSVDQCIENGPGRGGRACDQNLPPDRSRKDSLESERSAAIVPHELVRTRQLESIHLKFNLESGTLLPLCLRGRLLHGRHFTYKSISGDTAITFVSLGVEGAFATEEHPYAAHGPWLQVLLTEEFVEQMLEDLQDLSAREELTLPREFSWTDKKLKISILPDCVFDSPLQ